MDTVKAAVVVRQDKYTLEIALEHEVARIPLSEDNPNHVKSAFNKLLERTRLGQFHIDYVPEGDDLFSHVAKEYITQLNRELAEIWKEMRQHKLDKVRKS